MAAPASATAPALTAALHALASRVQVVVLPAISAPTAELEQAIADATDAGTLVIASGANVSTLATEQPAALPEVLSTGMLGIDTSDFTHATTFTAAGRCSGHGPQVRAAVASDRCADGAAMITAGIAGLAFSAARQHGHPLEPSRLRAWMSQSDLDARAIVDRAAAGDTTPVPRVTQPTPYRYVSRTNGFDLAATDTASVSVCLATTDAGCFTVPLTNDAGHVDKVMLSAGLATLTPFTQALRLEPTGGGERTLVFGVDDSAMFGPYPLAVSGVGASPPRLVDLDGDGSDELIVAGVDGRIHALGGSGQEVAGFPIDTGGTIEQPLAFDDLLGIGHVNLIAVTREGQLTAFGSTGA
ncbi:MAG TPA: hypothetical protein VLV15_08320, partial [Dongiaceae bacterium]|nr:hypothetical protein [Dongiaceae bacterium]